jgi:hypothetical protein
MTEGKSPEQEGVKELLENAGNKERRAAPCRSGLINECDGMVPK